MKEKLKIDYPDYFGQVLHKEGFRVWAKYMFKVIRKSSFIEEDLHSGLFKVFQEVYNQDSTRDTINVPPRSSNLFYSLCLG